MNTRQTPAKSRTVPFLDYPSKPFLRTFALWVGLLSLFASISFCALAQENMGPLRVCPDNSRYFCDSTGKAILLTGSHTWSNLADMGPNDPPVPLDFNAHLNYLEDLNHNFIRLWSWELVRIVDGYVTPHPYARTGSGTALDGKPNFNLRVFDSAYFDRLRTRVIAASQRGIYVGVMLFEGYGLQFHDNAWRNHPYHPGNNVNTATDVLYAEWNGLALHTLEYPIVTELQEAYVRKVVDTLNDLDNVVYEIANESHPGSTAWQYYMMDFVRAYQQQKPKQHPVGMTFQYQGGSNGTLFTSSADWISPNDEGGYKDNPPANDGSKVILSDTDHLWGVGGDQRWVWKSFLRGLNPIFMDPYDGVLMGLPFDPQYDPIRLSMGYARALAEKVDLTWMTPQNALASTTYCLADRGNEYLVYLPYGGNATVNLTDVSNSVSVEWFNPNTGLTQTAATVAGGALRTFYSPFGGNDVVLHLRAATTANQPPVLNPVGNRQVTAGQTLQFTVSGWDPDGDALAFAGNNIPSGATFSAATRTFSWTPGTSSAGTYSNVLFSVTDDATPSLTDSESITISVTAAAGSNNPPVFEPIGDKQVQPGAYLDFIVNATDPDPGDWMSYSVANLPPGANWWPGAHRLTWSTTTANVGSYVVTFTATDHGVPPLSTSETITITIGDAPVAGNRAPTLNAIGSKQVYEGQLLQFSVTASDPDAGDILTLSAANLPTGATFAPASGTFSWTPNDGDAGVYTNVRFTVTDSEGLSDSEAISITVSASPGTGGNNPPVFEPIGDRQVDPGTWLDLIVNATDPDPNDWVSYSVANLPAGANWWPGAHRLTWGTTSADVGSYVVTFTATDHGTPALSTSESVTITIGDAPATGNRAPILSTIGSKQVYEGQSLQFSAAASDPDAGDTLTFSATNLPLGASFNPSSGAFSWTPATGSAGAYANVVFSVTDSGGLSDSEAITITVLASSSGNNPPVFEPIGDKQIQAGGYLDIIVTATDPDDHDWISYSVANLPPGANWWSGAHRLTWATNASSVGTYYVTFTATDHGTPVLSTSKTITITVTAP